MALPGIITRCLASFGRPAILRFFDDTETRYAGLKAPPAINPSVDYTLPPAPPAADGYALISSTLGVLNWAAAGEANLAANVGSGTGLFIAKSGVTLQFRTLVTVGNISLIPGADTITLGTTAEINAAVNIGVGISLFAGKAGSNLQFKTLKPGSNITISADADSVTINSTGSGSGESNTASNLGSGVGWFKGKVGFDLQFKTAVAGTDITIANNVNDLAISAVGTVPIGAVLDWLKTFSGVPPLPASFAECNGQTLADVESPFNGTVLPDLNNNNYFTRGGLTSGVLGGAATHLHTVPTSSMFQGSASARSFDIGSTDAASSLPPFYQMVKIMRIK